MNLIPKGIVVIALFFSNSFSYSQTVFWTETFDGTSCAAGSGCDPSIVAWTTTNTGTNGAKANKFYVSCQENGNAVGACGSGCGTNQTLHLGNVSTSSAAFLFCPTGDCGAAYDASGAGEVTNKRCESPTVSCAGKSGISIAFKYIEGGETTLDDATCWYFDGSTWAQIDNMPKTALGCGGQGIWALRTVTLPASANNNANVRVGFRWVNNGNGAGSDPSFATNDVQLRYTTVLPIELLSFEAQPLKDDEVLIKWSTASELNNDFFTLERSMDGNSFEPFQIIRGAGNSSQTLNYQFIDNKPFNEITYYRLRQTDFNGEFSYSHLVAVKMDNVISEDVMVYPNPANDFINVLAESEMTSVKIMDIGGSEWLNQNVSEQKFLQLNISELPSGLYIVEANVDGILSRKKVFISK